MNANVNKKVKSGAMLAYDSQFPVKNCDIQFTKVKYIVKNNNK